MTLAFGIYCAAGLAAFGTVATTTIRDFPGPWGRIFFGLALIACVVTLTGVARAHTALGVLTERAGLVAMFGVCSCYAVWAFGNSRARALAFGLMLLALAGASLWRTWQISRALYTARKAVVS
ncbi:hypothetical protein VA596_49885 [Amycolatopsis sp., V23-08]|uniref:Uncharacterized protein n=1 Tax=Amycolatopsis heterodermiae TaxID=3110235 RepID=A0ABU5RN27_9PSEU|nr:hypothetical protein [Amycolatopsis sp., V23-08]MEA5367722.1 hypothetical protein [Amycolatopsis sp., V23-08]